MLVIKNDGPFIADTNYWETELTRQGQYLYLSYNAGAVRLLLPDGRWREEILDALKTTREVVVSQGRFSQAPEGRGVEVLLDDHTETPYGIQLSMGQCDRWMPQSEHGRSMRFIVYVRGGSGAPEIAYDAIAHFRIVSEIPCLERWPQA